MKQWIRWLTTTGTIVGVLVILYGVVRFVAIGSIPALLIAISILIVGPGEDLLTRWAHRTATTPEAGDLRATIVDRSTSLAFLVLLGVAILLM